MHGFLSKLRQSEEQKKLSAWMKALPGFNFDKSGIKNRLMTSIAQAGPEPERHKFFLPASSLGLVLASLVLLVGFGTLAYADQAKPGDALFGLSKAADRVILALPFSAETKAKIQEQIVTSRLEVLENLNLPEAEAEIIPVVTEKRALEAAKESDESLMKAIESVTESQQRLEKEGKEEAAQRLTPVLEKLESLAEKHETRIERIEKKASETTRKEIHKYLEGIKQTRSRALDALKNRNNDREEDRDRRDGQRQEDFQQRFRNND